MMLPEMRLLAAALEDMKAGDTDDAVRSPIIVTGPVLALYTPDASVPMPPIMLPFIVTIPVESLYKP